MTSRRPKRSSRVESAAAESAVAGAGRDAPTGDRDNLASVLTALDEVVWSSSPDGAEVYFIGEGCERLYGRPARAFRDAPDLWREVIHPDDRPQVDAAYGRLLDGEGLNVEYRIIRPDGSARWVHDRAVVIRDAAGRPARIGGLVSDITDRRIEEEERRQSEALLRSVFHSTHDGILALDLETGRFRLANPAMCRMLGRTEEELLRLGPYDIHPGALRDRVTRELEALVRGEQESVRAVPTLRQDGSSFLADISVTPVHLQDRACLLGVFRDVTAQQMAQREATASHDLLEAVLDTTPVLVAFLDPSFNFVRVNLAYAAKEGMAPDDFLGKNHFELYPNAENEALFRRVRDSGVPYEARAKPFAYPYAPERGITHWDWSLTPLQEEDGTPTGLVLTLVDVTERVRAIESARTDEARARAVFSQSAVGMAFVGFDGRVLEANGRLATMVGLAPAALRGLPIAALTHPEDRAAQRDLARQTWGGTLDASGLELRYLRADGSPIWVNVTLSPVTGAGGVAEHFVAIVTDISARTALEEGLRESRQQLRNILDSMFIFVGVFTTDGLLVDLNEAPLRAVGVAREAVLGLPFWVTPWFRDLPESRQQAREAIERAARGETARGDLQARAAGDGIITLDATFSPLRDSQGRITGVVASGAEITARLEAERAVEENRRLLREILDSMFSFVVVCDPDGTAREINRTPLLAAGLRREEVIGRRFADSHFWSHAPEARAQIRRALAEAATGRAVREDFSVRLAGDVVLTVDGALAPIRNLAGEVIAVVGSGVDVTDRRKAEALVRESEARLAEAQSLARVGSWELDLGTGDLTWSDEIFRIFEVDPSRFEASYEAFLDAIHPEDRDRVSAAFRESVETGRPYEITHRLLLPSGHLKHVQERGQTFHDHQGTASRSVGTVQDITERVLAERDLHVKGTALASASTAVAMADLAGNITYVNAAFLELWGYPREDEVLGSSAMDHWERPEDAGQVMEVMFREGSWTGEIRARRRDGGIRTMQVSAHLVREPDGSPVCLMAWFLDVTDRIEAERRLARSEARFRQTFEQAAVGMVMCDLQGRFQEVNSRFVEITGYGREELERITFREITHPDDLALDETQLRRLMAGEIATYTMEKRYIRKGGGEIWVQLTVSGRRERGELVQLLGVVEDISDRKRWELALRRSEANLLRAERLARLGSWEWDLERNRMEWSPELYRIYGLRPEEVGEPALETALALIPPEDAARLRAAHERALASGRSEPIEFRVGQDAREYRTVRAETQLVAGADGQWARMFGVVQDITEKKQAEERITAQLREKEVLLREIHHRVKNNLQVISSLLYFQASGTRDPAVKALFDESRNRVTAMALVHETLYQSADLGHVDFAQYVQRLANGLTATYAGRAAATIAVAVTAPPLDIEVAVPCALIVSEAVTNALKYAFPEGRRGTIRVELAEPDPGRLRLVVADDGVGFRPEEPQDMSRLGMRLVQALADQLTGELTVDGSRGTRISVSFPSRS